MNSCEPQGTDKMAPKQPLIRPKPSSAERIPSPPLVHQIILTLGATAVALSIQGLGFLYLMEWAVLDQWFRWRPAETKPVPVVVVAIDDDDIAEIGNWPLSDQQLAKFLRRLDSHEPSAIGLNLYRNLPIEPGETELAQFLAETPYLIGVEKIIGEGASPAIPPAPVLKALDQVAFNDLVLDSDGHVRRHLVSMRPQNETRLALGTKLALLHLEQFQITPEALENSRIRLGLTEITPLRPKAGAYVQADIGGFQMLANYFRPSSEMPVISFQDVLDDSLSPDLIRNKIVLVGLKADSTWGDRFYTPFSDSSDATWSGVEIQAQLTSQLVVSALTGRAPLRSLSELAEWLWILGWAGVGVICNRNLLINWQLLRLPLFTGLLIAGSYSLFLAHYWVPLLAPLLALEGAWLGTQGYLVWHRLRSENRILELAVKERTQQLEANNRELDEARIAAEQASQAKSMFLAHMSHELRTPLTAILGFGDLLERSPALPDEEKSYAETIKRCGNHLLTIINNVLELSRMEAEAAEINRVALHLPTFFYEMEYMFQAEARSKQLSLYCHLENTVVKGSPLEWVEVDETKLRQIVINLLGNAVKFTATGHVQLSANLLEMPQENSGSDSALALECAVEDTGPGLSEAEIKQLFQSFVQTSAGKKLGKGTGLGLSLVAQWIELMGGHIDVRSTVGEGSCFIFRIPVTPAAAPLETAPQELSTFSVQAVAKQELISQPPALEQARVEIAVEPEQTFKSNHPRILIVDDEDDNRRLLTHWLSEASFEIETADTGIAALEKAESWHPHIILLDVHLPDFDGYEVARRIRQHGEKLSQRISSTWVAEEEPIILAITAGVLEEHYAELLAAGCDDVLWKPIRVETLFSKVSEYLEYL